MHLFMHIIEMIGINVPLVVSMFITQRLLKIPDLSIETAYMVGSMSSCFCIPYLTAMPSCIAAPLLLAMAIITGGLVGLCSSIITTHFSIAHLFSAIITTGIGVGVIFTFMSPYQGITGYTNHLVMLKTYGIVPVVMLINIVLVVLCTIMMRSQLGYLAIATGNNPRFFNTFGLSYNRVFCTGVIIANGLAGLSGYLVSQTMFFADIHMGLGKVLFTLVALMIGRLFIQSNRALFIVPLVGTTVQVLTQQFLLRIGFNLNYFSLVHGVILLALIALAHQIHHNTFSEMEL
jgi:putative tryptophan/tyrosine transport system permease protein